MYFHYKELLLFAFSLTGKQEAVDATLATLDVLPEPFKLFAHTLVEVCAYAGE